MPIFDQGYQHWRGALSGHAWRWLAVARHGVRVQLKNRVLRLLLLVAWLPALLLIAAVAVWGLVEQQSEGALALVRTFLPADILLDPRAYRGALWTIAYSFFFKAQMFFIMLLVVVAGPGLISRDLRFNALPLYFSRPLTRLDYLLGKLGVIGALVAAVAVGPAAFAYVLGICFSLDVGVVRDTYPVLLASVAYGLTVTLSVGSLMLALSSLTRRSLYVGIAWAGIWIISGSVGSIMTEVHRESVRRGLLEDELSRWVQENPPPPGARMRGSFPVLDVRPGSHKPQLAGVAPDHEAEAEEWFDAWSRKSQQVHERAARAESEALRGNWWPLCSYVANLERMADFFLDTRAAWVTVGKAVVQPQKALGAAFGPRGGRRSGPPVDENSLANQFVAQWPWEWSAGVLAGLLGLSTWTLFRRVRSLDRLK
jgi:ABC-type transport system involved in multi-copper enzyme maturation permease subunit